MACSVVISNVHSSFSLVDRCSFCSLQRVDKIHSKWVFRSFRIKAVFTYVSIMQHIYRIYVYNSSRDEIREKNSRIHLDRLKYKCTNCKGAKNDTNFGQITGIQEKLDTTCKKCLEIDYPG